MGLVAKAFQDIITFSRASSGTYVNSNGYITNSSVLNYLTYSNQPENAAWTKSNSFVQQNLLLYSNDWSNAVWTKTSVTITSASTLSPDGTLNASKIESTATGAGVYNSAVVAATSATASVYLKQGTGATIANGIGLRNNTTATNLVVGTLDYSTGVFTYTVGSTGVVVTNVGNGWWRVSLTATSGITSGDTLRLYTGLTGAASTAGDFCYAYGAQLVQGSVPGDYRATTSAALPCLYADYNGALRARKLCESAVTNVHLLQNNVATVGASQVVSVYAKAAERSQLYLQVGTTGAYFNLSTGAVISGSGATVTLVRDGWYRCEVSASPVLTNTNVFVAVANGGVNSYAGDGSSGIYIADAQLNDGSAATAYWDNATGSATYAPRFDYNPATLAAEGFVVEEQRANLLLQSNDFQTSWTQVNITRTLNSILSPSGNVDGVKIAATASAATVETQGATVAATSATGSAYVKQGTSATTANFFTLRNQTTLTDLISGTLNYSTGVFTYITGSTGVVVLNAGNGWWRIAISATAGITSGDTVRLYVGFAGGAATAGDHLYAYGAQLEAGAFATSYIPTVASQVTRAADVASVNTLSPWYNSVAGTLYVEYDVSVVAGTMPIRALAAFSDGTTSNRIYQFLSNSSLPNLVVTDAGVAQASISNSAISANVTVKTAATFTANDFALVTNGGTVATDLAGTNPTAITRLELGAFTATATYLSGHLRRITYYPRRLTNAELQTLTTL